jgi:hypothetical protein
MGKIKQFFGQRSNAERLQACQQELNNALEMFKVYLLEFISVAYLNYHRFELPA